MKKIVETKIIVVKRSKKDIPLHCPLDCAICLNDPFFDCFENPKTPFPVTFKYGISKKKK